MGLEMMFDVMYVVIGMDYRDLNEMVGWGLLFLRGGEEWWCYIREIMYLLIVFF